MYVYTNKWKKLHYFTFARTNTTISTCALTHTIGFSHVTTSVTGMKRKQKESKKKVETKQKQKHNNIHLKTPLNISIVDLYFT